MSGGLARAAAAACVAAGIATAGLYAREARDRAEVRAYLARTTLDVRRPELVATVALEPSAAHAAFQAAGGGVADLTGTVRLSGLNPGAQSLWRAALERQGETARETTALLAGALAARPAEARALGRLADLSLLREARGELTPSPAWRDALAAATRLAPGDDGLAASRARALLGAWRELAPAERSEAPAVFRRAFLDRAFLRSGFLPVAAAIGPRPAVELLPESASALAAALAVLEDAADFESVAALFARQEAAERRERATALADLEALRARGNARELVDRARAFLAAYPLRRFDDAEGREVGRRLLAVLPGEPAGSWWREGRADAVRWALEGRAEAKGADLARLTALLSGVPGPVKARIALSAGDRVEWERVVRQADVVDTLEWTPFWVALARQQLEARETSEALAALRHVNPFAQGECDVLLVRRDVARAAGDADGERVAEEGLAKISPAPREGLAFSDRGTLPLCVDPKRQGRMALELTLRPAGAPSIVGLGWDGGIQESVEVVSSRTVTVPLAGLSGRRVLGLSKMVGPLAVPESTRLVEVPSASR